MMSVAAVALHVSDVERSLVFWRDVFGMRINHDSGWTGDAAVFEPSGLTGATGARMVLLTAPETPAGPPGPNQPAGVTLIQFRGLDTQQVRGRFQDPGTVHVALWVDDFDARVKAFTEAGFPLLGPVTESVVGDGIRLAMIADPDGFTLELIAA